MTDPTDATDPPGKPTLEATVALLEATLEATHDAVLVVDLDRHITRFNRRFVEMCRLPPAVAARRDRDEILALVAEQLEDPDAMLLLSPELWTDVTGHFLTLLRFKDGRVFERYVAPQRVGTAIVGRVVSYRDISASVRAGQALEQHRAFLEKAQEVAHIGSWVLELDGSEQLGWSTETHRIFGVPLGEFAGTADTFFALVHRDDRDAVRAATAAAVAGGAPYDIVHRIVAADGSARWVHERADVLHDASGRPARMIGTVQDVTERRQLEEQLRHAQKLDAIGTLAGGIAHDLNNALTAIAGYTELALMVLAADHPARDDVQETRRAAERAASVTRQLLAFSRKQRLEPRVFDLNETVGSLGRLLGRVLGDNVHLRTSLQHGLPPIHADPGQIEQAIVNLAVNARDAMPDGGDLVLGTSLERLDATAASARTPMPAGVYVTLSVSDTGHGMTAETRTHIFEPFYTTKDVGKGTGLGLAMVYGTVKQSGGFIFVESEPDRGSTFRVFFPPAGTRDAAAPPAHHTLLVLDEQEAVCALVSSTLARDGYAVVSAGSAEEALGLDTDGGGIDLLLVDARVRLEPNTTSRDAPGARGLAVANLFLAARPNLPVMVMAEDDEDVLEGLPPSVSILRKPFTPIELRRRVWQILVKPYNSAPSQSG